MRLVNVTNHSYSIGVRILRAIPIRIPYMTTLTTPPLSTLLPRLLADAEATSKQMTQLSPEEREKLRTSPTDYQALYSRMKDFHLAVSRETGVLLYMLARATAARAIVEFGTSFGVSTLHLAAALRDNGGGRLISTEFEPSKVGHARENLAAAGLSDLVEIREGDALETLARDLPDSIDLVLLDGAKPLYPRILSLIESRLRVGALIVADNADWCPDYLALVRSPSGGYLSVPFAADVELSMKLGPAWATQ
jgi:predicted O-methyltransferase YrrM